MYIMWDVAKGPILAILPIATGVGMANISKSMNNIIS